MFQPMIHPHFDCCIAVPFSLEENQRKAAKMIKRYEWPSAGNRLNSPVLFSLKKRNLGEPDRHTGMTWERYMKGRSTLLALCSWCCRYLLSVDVGNRILG